MLGRHLILGGTAFGALSWRLWDPKGSYAALYDASHAMTDWLAGYEVLSRLVSLILVDQFNGLMMGIAASTLLYLTLGGLRSMITWPFRRSERVPQTRYHLPNR